LQWLNFGCNECVRDYGEQTGIIEVWRFFTAETIKVVQLSDYSKA